MNSLLVGSATLTGQRHATTRPQAPTLRAISPEEGPPDNAKFGR
jgi:hypothetical protein